jgi:hypothetical protein
VIRRPLVAGGLAVATVWAGAGPAAAHGVGGRIDLPLPAWQLAWAAGFAVASSFVILGVFWDSPRLADGAAGEPLPGPVQVVGRAAIPLTRLIGLAAFAILLFATWRGSVNGAANIAPVAVYIAFWVGLQIVSALVGDVWRGFNPFYTLADLGAGARARITGTPMSAIDHGAGNQWWAVGAIFSFLWMELCYHSSASPRSIGVWLTLYTAAMVTGSMIWGRGWVRDADGFGVLFTKLGAIAPLFRDGDGRWRVRSPLAGLAILPVRPGTVAFVVVVLGSTSFDGFTRSSIWLDVGSNRTGWELTAVNTVGILFVIGAVALVYRTAIRVMSQVTGDGELDLARAFGPSLVPIAMAYAIAHYFSYLVLEGQVIFIHISDPFGRGWDLFGTVDYIVDYTWLSTSTIAWIQTVAIAGGHVLGVTAAHDRAVERWDRTTAVRSQYPMLVAMIAYTVAGLFLLLGA